MTFNQWCCNRQIRLGPVRLALEAIWNELSGAGLSPSRIGQLFDALMEDLGR